MSTTIDYMHICDYAFVAEGGKAAIIGIFDKISATTFPTNHPYMAVALKLRDEPHRTLPIKITVARPNGDKLAELDGAVATGDDGSANVNLNLVNLQFQEPGRYLVKVASKGETLASQSLILAKVAAPPVSRAS